MADLDFLWGTYEGDYLQAVKAWQEAGTVKTYILDVSNIAQNQIKGVRLSVQNYWYYDENGNMVEYPLKKEGDSDTDASGNTINYGTGVERIYIKPTVYISPITVYTGEEPTYTVASTTTGVPTTTAESNPGAGYHFFDFTADTQCKEYGNAVEQLIYNEYTEKEGVDKLYDKEYGGVTLKSPNNVNKQHQMGWLVRSSDDNKTVIDDAVTKRVYNQMKQALAYAQGPGGLNTLACDVTVISAKHAATKEDCSVECQVAIHANEDQYLDKAKYVNIGQSTTILLDVSELELDNITGVRLSPMNYANVDPDTGNACGLTGLEVKYSAVYVAGKEFATAAKTTEKANSSEADALYELYKQLPGTSLSDYDTPEAYAILEKFMNAYWDLSTSTQDYFQEKYVSMDDIGALIEIYNELGFYSDDVPTGTSAAPIAALFVAAAAGFVMIRSRKK